MPVFDHPARVTVETGSSSSGIGTAVAAVAAIAALAAVAAFVAEYALVIAAIGVITAVGTAGAVWVLWRRWTVLEMPSPRQQPRSAVPAPLAVVIIRPAQVSPPAPRRALPAPAAARLGAGRDNRDEWLRVAGTTPKDGAA